MLCRDATFAEIPYQYVLVIYGKKEINEKP